VRFRVFPERRRREAICLDQISVGTLRYGAVDRVDEIITMLDQSVVGCGGQVSFGACYALALIGQSLPQYAKPLDSKEESDQPHLPSRRGFLQRTPIVLRGQRRRPFEPCRMC
jgi:hypothetical protein